MVAEADDLVIRAKPRRWGWWRRDEFSEQFGQRRFQMIEGNAVAGVVRQAKLDCGYGLLTNSVVVCRKQLPQ